MGPQEASRPHEAIGPQRRRRPGRGGFTR